MKGSIDYSAIGFRLSTRARTKCHLVFRFVNFFTKSSARPASRIVDIVTVFLAALAVLIVNISFSPKTKWH